ncbi:MAG: exodeoxyribonuclease VII large subunit [Armatimonadota bacterium]|nr:exodeoxyribonuclease VII large subunit [Armatimonadota bacterium]
MFEVFPENQPKAPQGMSILTVTELTRCIRAVIEAEDLFADVWVRGEVSNLKEHTSGHIYFSLKDENALIRCVIWRNSTSGMQFNLADGMSVILHGRVTVYEKQGQYELVVSEVTPDGIGALFTAYEQLKARLQAEGLFDKSRKKQLPEFPRRIALITSPTGAALQDMLTIAVRRLPCINIILIPTLMQGEDSQASVVDSLKLAESIPDVDVIIIGRGGGSIEDLWTFNSESVVRAICACQKPVVSAIGHETDFTLADFAADLRAPTPSAAAELVVPDKDEILSRISTLSDAMKSAITALIMNKKACFNMMMKSRVFAHPEVLVQERWQALDTLTMRLANSLDRQISNCSARLGEVTAKLHALSPLQVLSRGYAIVRHDGQLVKKISDVEVGDSTETLISDGRLVSEIKEIKEGWGEDG